MLEAASEVFFGVSSVLLNIDSVPQRQQQLMKALLTKEGRTTVF